MIRFICTLLAIMSYGAAWAAFSTSMAILHEFPTWGWMGVVLAWVAVCMGSFWLWAGYGKE